MTTKTAEGIILQACAFQEADQILTAFTSDGLLKLIYKGALSKKRGRGALTTPLQQVEFVYAKRKGEICSCREISIINSLASLRQKLEYLESAGEMAAAASSLLPIGVPAPLLYHLFLQYLSKIPLVGDPFVLSASFKMKMLRHEGMLSLLPECALCKEEIHELSFSSGECYCPSHAPFHGISFTKEETDLLMVCTYAKSMGLLSKQQSTPPFLDKVRRLFKTQLT